MKLLLCNCVLPVRMAISYGSSCNLHMVPEVNSIGSDQQKLLSHDSSSYYSTGMTNKIRSIQDAGLTMKRHFSIKVGQWRKH